MTLPDIAAAIVAGGRARRFGGRDKSRLMVEGRAIIVRQTEVLRRLTPTVFIVANDAAPFEDLGFPVHPDLIPDVGALGGLYTALESSPAERVIVVACDLPFLDGGVLARLVELSDAADGAWIRTTRGVEPLLACYRRSVAPVMREAIEAGRLRLSDLGRLLKMAELGEDELTVYGATDRLLANVNTPDDYSRLQ